MRDAKDKYTNGVACQRCHSLFCKCAFETLGPPVVALSDFDVERIAQRVVELMRAERGGQ